MPRPRAMLEVVGELYLFGDLKEKEPRGPRCSAISRLLENVFIERNLIITVRGYCKGPFEPKFHKNNPTLNSAIYVVILKPVHNPFSPLIT